jgi:hypothetical protein
MALPSSHMKRPRVVAPVMVALLLIGAALGVGRLEAGPAHPLYLTFGKLELEGPTAVLDIRIFWDDLMLDMRRLSGDPTLQVRGPDTSIDAVVSYINDHLVFGFDGRVVRGVLEEWGVDGEANRYRLRYPLSSDPSELEVRNGILLGLYEDQKNILHVLRRGGRERAFYFARRAEEQTIRLQGR